MKRAGIAAVAIAALFACAAAVAQQKSIIDQRQDLMKNNGAQSKVIGDYLKDGKGTPADVEKAAAQIAENAKKIPALFPAGTGMAENPGKSYAKPELWQDKAKFDGFVKALGEGAAKLQAAAKTGDKAQIEAASGEMGKQGCGACHQAFRAPKT